jgi:hypothetical protein
MRVEGGAIAGSDDGPLDIGGTEGFREGKLVADGGPRAVPPTEGAGAGEPLPSRVKRI